MLFVIFWMLITAISMCVIKKHEKSTNLNDIILGITFLCGVYLCISGFAIAYSNQNYPYYEEFREEVERVVLTGKRPVMDYGENYGYRIMDDEIREVDKDLVEFKVEDVEEPYLRILSVKRTYDVEKHKLFNVLVAFRFEDYTKTLDDYVYEFHVSEKVE